MYTFYTTRLCACTYIFCIYMNTINSSPTVQLCSPLRSSSGQSEPIRRSGEENRRRATIPRFDDYIYIYISNPRAFVTILDNIIQKSFYETHYLIYLICYELRFSRNWNKHVNLCYLNYPKMWNFMKLITIGRSDQ